MTRRDYIAASALAVAVAAAGVGLAVTSEGRAAGSVLSHAPDGWLIARLYLEARGGRVSLLDDATSEPSGVLVLVFPWQRFDPEMGLERARRHLHRGGTLLFAYSGRGSWEEPAAAAALGMGHQSSQERPPLHPLRWREHAGRAPTLAPAAGVDGLEPLRVTRPQAWVTPPAGATVLFREEGGRPAAFSYAYGPGRVFVVPANAFSNGRIGQAGNAALLESLFQALGPDWAFDEFHHGMVPVEPSTAATASMRAMDLFLLQLAFVYALAVLEIARRFGPPWDDPPVVAGSTASFLRGVGALHHRLGHHRAAAALLVDRARQLYPRLAIPDTVPHAGGEAALLPLARAVGRAQTGEERTR